MSNKIVMTAFTVVPLALAACAAQNPGARPHDMSAARHATEAERHGDMAGSHAARYDASARAESERCPISPTYAPTEREPFCWTWVRNPTDYHRGLAAEHRRHAAEHRAASAALRDAEANACGGIAGDDRDISPFEHVEDIASVTATQDGATVVFKPIPGMTADGLQRLVGCHLARNTALGHTAPEMPDCPLVPRGVSAQVHMHNGAAMVEIHAADAAGAQEVQIRVNRLKATAGATP